MQAQSKRDTLISKRSNVFRVNSRSQAQIGIKHSVNHRDKVNEHKAADVLSRGTLYAMVMMM